MYKHYIIGSFKNSCSSLHKSDTSDKFEIFTEKRMLVLSWYTALVANVESSSFSTEQLSPVHSKKKYK